VVKAVLRFSFIFAGQQVTDGAWNWRRWRSLGLICRARRVRRGARRWRRLLGLQNL